MNNIIKALPILLRLVLGSIFLVYGLDGFIHFMPSKTLSEQAGTFIAALINSGYLWTLLKASEIIGGFLLLTNLYVPLALVLLAPITVNIFCFHLFMNPARWVIGIYPVGVTIVVAQLALAWFYKEYFRSLFVRNATTQIPPLESLSTIESTD